MSTRAPEGPRASEPDPTLQALFAEVYAHPHDDSRRLVLADALEERGSPRGAFITLQLAAARGQGTRRTRGRESALVHAHRALLHGTLAKHVTLKMTKFGRGFPADVMANGSSPTDEAELAAWNTVEVLDARAEGTRLVADAELLSLTSLTTRWETLAQRRRPLPVLERLDLPWGQPDGDLGDLEAALALLPALERLATWATSDPEAIWRFLHRIPARVGTCELVVPAPELVPLARRWASERPRTLVMAPMWEAQPEGTPVTQALIALSGDRLELIGDVERGRHSVSLSRLRELRAFARANQLTFSLRGDDAWTGPLRAALG